MNTKNLGLKEIEKKYGRYSFGRFLESHRLSEGMNQKEFAEYLGMTASSICDLEKERKIPTLSRALRIAEMLDVSKKTVITLVLQDHIHREGLDFKVSVA